MTKEAVRPRASIPRKQKKPRPKPGAKSREETPKEGCKVASKRGGLEFGRKAPKLQLSPAADIPGYWLWAAMCQGRRRLMQRSKMRIRTAYQHRPAA
jgi:hypothetical protein